MSEPVGTGPRSTPAGMPEITGNTHKDRDAREAAAEPPEPVSKIIEGKVITRKQVWYKRFMRSIVAEDAKSIGPFIYEEVIVPNLKNVLRDIVVGSTDRALYGRLQSGRTAGPVTSILGRGSSIRTQYERMSEEPRRISREARARHVFDDIILTTHSEAELVLDALIERCAKYGSATVADLYDYLGQTSNHADRNWGWTNLDSAKVQQTRAGFLLDLPRTEPLR